MRVLVIGGTGFLGSALCRRLNDAGHTVTAVARHAPSPGLLPDAVAVMLADVAASDDEEIARLVAGFEGVVYALGPDDRSPLGSPADAFLERELVRLTERVVVACRDAGVRRFVLLGSYFTAAGRRDARFAARHPYVRARIAQQDRAVAAAGDELAVCTIEIPYVFGVSPGARAAWKAAYDVVAAIPVLPGVDGGTSAATIDAVLDTVVAALERGEPGATYPVSDGHLTWRRWAELAWSELDHPVRFVPWPRALTVLAGGVLSLVQRLLRHEAGLTPGGLADDVVHTHRRVDGAPTRAALGLPDRTDDLEAQIRATVRAARPDRRGS